MAEFGKFHESVYLAVIGDLVASREVEDRAGLQKALSVALTEISDRLGGVMVADLQLTAGDEIQGLFVAPAAAIDAIQAISDAIQPERAAFGLGVGPLSTGPLPRDRTEIQIPLLDGPCFHAARAALEVAARNDVWAVAQGFGPFDGPLNAILELTGTLRGRWKDRQALYAAAARHASQKEVAAAHDVSPSVVSESLKGAYFDTVRRGEQGARELLNTLASEFGKFTES